MLFDEIQNEARIAPLEARKLTKGGRCNVVIHVVRVLAVGDIGGICTESKLVPLRTLRMRDMDGELTVESDVQGKVKGKALGIGGADIILQNIDV